MTWLFGTRVQGGKSRNPTGGYPDASARLEPRPLRHVYQLGGRRGREQADMVTCSSRVGTGNWTIGILSTMRTMSAAVKLGGGLPDPRAPDGFVTGPTDAGFQPAFLTGLRDEPAQMVLAARPATVRARRWRNSGQAEASVEEVYPERPFAKGRPSVTQQARPYPPTQSPTRQGTPPKRLRPSREGGSR
jgi:hypothetical protein